MPNALDRTYRKVLNKIGPYGSIPHHSLPDTPIHEEWLGRDDLDPAGCLEPMNPADAPGVQQAGDERYGPLDTETRRWIDGGIRDQGMEALAFYKSFRFVALPPFPGYWGIFYLDAGIRRVQEQVAQYLADIGDARRTAVEFLRRHERVHFKVDVYALGLESALSKHLYEPMRQAFRGHSIYQVEEALANNEAWRWAKKSGREVEQFAKDFMSLQPGAYARYSEERSVLASELAANLIDHNFTQGAQRDDQALWVANLPTAMARWQSYCPENLVSAQSALSRWINPARKLPLITAIQDSKDVAKVLKGRYVNYRSKWEGTKSKLLQDPGLLSLNFKRWPDGSWSVRVDDNFRAHLLPVGSHGVWETKTFGSHTATGHG